MVETRLEPFRGSTVWRITVGFYEGACSSGELFAHERIARSTFTTVTTNFFFTCTGYGLGAVFGLFTAGVGPSMPNHMTGVADQSAKAILKDMKSRAVSFGKNFGVVGLMFSGTECLVESVSLFFCKIAVIVFCDIFVQQLILQQLRIGS